MGLPTYNPTQLEKGLRATFLTEFARVSQNRLIGLIGTTVSSEADSEKYGWLGEAPQMEEIDDRIKYHQLSDAGYTITNKEYAAGLAVRRRDIMNDQTGGIGLRTRQLASVAARHADKLAIAALVNGTTNTGYDAVAMFSDSHTARGDSGTIDNLLAGAGTSTANVATDINKCFEYFGNVLAENGETYHGDMEIEEVAFVFPWGMRKAFMEATGAAVISQTTNVQLDGIRVRLIPSGRLYAESSDANDWYALVTSGPVRPLIYQVREGVKWSALEENASDDAFDQNIYKYKAQAFHEVGYGPFQTACKMVNT